MSGPGQARGSGRWRASPGRCSAGWCGAGRGGAGCGGAGRGGSACRRDRAGLGADRAPAARAQAGAEPGADRGRRDSPGGDRRAGVGVHGPGGGRAGRLDDGAVPLRAGQGRPADADGGHRVRCRRPVRRSRRRLAARAGPVGGRYPGRLPAGIPGCWGAAQRRVAAVPEQRCLAGGRPGVPGRDPAAGAAEALRASCWSAGSCGTRPRWPTTSRPAPAGSRSSPGLGAAMSALIGQDG